MLFTYFCLQTSSLLHFLTYQTPPKFLLEFEEHAGNLNLRSIKIITSFLIIVSGTARILSFIFPNEVALISGYEELSLNNWLQIIGSISFLALSTYIIKNGTSIYNKKAITLAFVTYLLTISFNISYIISMYNTKNTLFVFLVGIMATSLFFTITYKHIKFVVIYIVSVYLMATIFSNVTIQEKIINFIAGLILGMILLSFSRYSYYFKSNHFVQIKELEEKNAEILLLNNQKSEILSFVAHDLRAPLNNIDALSQILLLEEGKNVEIKMIASSTLQAKTIINDLIEAVKTEPTDISKENIQLKPYITKIINKWETNCNRKIEFIQNNEELIIKANASKLERVIDNLISNAFKFSEVDKPVSIELSNLQSKVFIKVQDLGVGIPVALQAHVFEQFSRASRKGLLGEKSIGLGLHISYKIIEQHNGKLSVSSIENVGTTFTIQLPLKTA